MGRFRLFCFNVVLGTVAATACGMLLRRLPIDPPSLGKALLQFGIAGFVVGATVGVGAGVGPRPPLRPSLCVFAQLMVAVSSGVGGFIGSFFPQVFAAADRAVHEALENRGIVVGSWFGAVAGTALEIIHVYRMRRRAADRSR
jgi:hypothetical protein